MTEFIVIGSKVYIEERVYLPYYINIPANTTTKTRLKSSTQQSGRLTRAIINIPDGWDISAGIQINIGKRQTLPAPDNADTAEFFSGNNIPLELKPNVQLKEEELHIDAFNDDALNDHDCFVTFEVTHLKEIEI